MLGLGLSTDRGVDVGQSRDASASERRRDEITQAAAELFDRHGYHSTSMADIASAVGLSKPTMYHYFEGKDEILFEIHETFIDLLISKHERRSDSVNLAPEHELLEIMTDILEVIESHKGHVRVFFEHHRELSSAYRSKVRSKRNQYEAVVRETITEGIDAGHLRQIDPGLATLAVFGIANWSYQWFSPAGSHRPREIARLFWEIVMRGLSGTRDLPTEDHDVRHNDD